MMSCQLGPRCVVGLLVVLGLGGCKKAPAEPGPGPLARLEIAPRGLLLTSEGARRTLSAKGFDAAGRALTPPAVTWRSSTPASIAVDDQGEVVARVANGASQIFAEAEGVTSPPLLVAVTALSPGTLAVEDSQIIGEPWATDPDAGPLVGSTYEVVLHSVEVPAVGTLVVGTGAQPLGGRVVAARDDAGHVRVTLALVPVNELLPNLSISEQLDLANVEPELPADLSDTYDIARDGETIRFTPATGSSSGGLRQALKVPPFDECELKATGVTQWPITLSQAPTFSIRRKFLLDFVYTSGVGLERLVAKGELGATYDGTLTVALGFEGAVTCTKELAVIRIPVAGVLSLVVGGVIPISVGVKLEGKLTLASLEVGAKAEAKAQAEFGVACPHGASCEFVRSVTGTASATPVWKKPTANDVRVDASLGVFAQVEVGIGNPIFPKVRLSAVSVRTGPKVQASFAPWATQLLDSSYSASYSLSLESTAGVGLDLPGVLAQFGLTDITVLELQSVTQLAQSPSGTLTADRGSFAAQDTVNFEVALDPATLRFPPVVGPYNVREVILVRKVSASFVEVARAAATTGQATFLIPFTAQDSGLASEFSALVVTWLLPADNLALELERSASCVVTEVAMAGCEVRAMNNNGQVVGECGPIGSERGFFWDNGTMQTLGTLGGATSRAYGVNDARDVVGTSALAGGSPHAFLWRNGSMQDLGTLGGSQSHGRAINQAGHVAGMASTGTEHSHAFIWSGGMVDLGALQPQDQAHGYGINAADQVVGMSVVGTAYPEVYNHACLFSGGAPQDLGTGPWPHSQANAINGSGLVVGVIANASKSEGRAVSWTSGALAALSGASSVAYAVNESGVIAGEVAGRAVRWKDGVQEDLNSLLPADAGWTFTSARAVNDRGQIAGMGSFGGGPRGFLLTCSQ